MKPLNFYAGPAILPEPVLQKAKEAVENFEGTGLSILEISHRSKEVVAFIEEAEQLTKELLGLPEGYHVLFLSGGASSQFYMTAMNLLDKNATAGYVNTGAWSTKAIKEAKLFGNVKELASSKDDNFQYIPKDYDIPEDLSYLHLTSNNTIFGTQYFSWPETNVPIVCDMSSDIFSQPVSTPIDRFGIIYAGAQKNMGPAGTTLVIVREDMVGKVNRQIPSMLDYRTFFGKQSSFNTPPVYPIYVSMLTMRWIKELGGLKAMEKRNQEKAKLIYDEIDRNPCFTCPVAKEDRSMMNAIFSANDESYEKAFLDACKKADILGIKGHRSVGGFRASIYNAMEKSYAETLVDVMKNFAEKYAG